MRKNFIICVVLGLTLLLSLIIFNLFHNDPAQKRPAVASASTSLDTATSRDTAWFNLPKDNLTIPKPLPIPTLTADAPKENSSGLIEAAPINTNQIRVDFEKESNAKTASVNTISPYQIQAGSIIPAILITGINSDLPGQTIAQVRENIYDSVAGRDLLIPQGSKLLGIYDNKIVYGQQRVLVAWRRLIFPNGQSLNLDDGSGADVSGYAGFKDEVDNHYARVFSSALLMSLIGAGLQLSQPQESAKNDNAPSVNQVLAQNVGINLSQASLQILQKNLNIQPTLAIRPGYLFNVSVVKDLILDSPSH